FHAGGMARDRCGGPAAGQPFPGTGVTAGRRSPGLAIIRGLSPRHHVRRRARMPPSAPLTIRWGTAQAAPGEPDGALQWPELDPERHPSHWPALLQRLAALDMPVLLLHAGTRLAPAVATRLLAAARGERDAILGALDNIGPRLSPRPPGTTIPAPLDIDALARTCAWLGGEQRVDSPGIPMAAAVWLPGAAQRLLDAG